MSRLNDPNREVRESAIKAMGRLEIAKDAPEQEAAVWSQLIQELFRAISLHLHGADEKTRDLLLGDYMFHCQDSSNRVLLSFPF